MRLSSIVVLMVLFLMPLAHAAEMEFGALTAEQLKGMLDKKTKVVVVDARTAEEYRIGHIPGAVNVPPDSLDRIEAILPRDKKVTLVFYCRGFG